MSTNSPAPNPAAIPAESPAEPGRRASAVGAFSRDAFIIGSGLMIGRLLGFVRELLLARIFGVSAEMDALVVSLNIIDTLAGMLLGSAAASVIMPPLAQLHSENREQEFWQLSVNLGNIVGCVLSVFSLLGVLGARPIVHLIAPGLSSGALDLAVRLTRIGCASLVFVGVGFLLAPVLQARRRFVVPAYTNALQNLVVILFIVFAVSRWGVVAVVLGGVVGSALRLAMMYWKARSEGLRWRWLVDWRDSQTLQIFRRILPAILSFSVIEISLLIDRNFASYLQEGSISALNYADKLVQVPLAIFPSAVSLAVLPTFAVHARNENWSAMRRELLSALRLVALLALPASLFLMALRVPLIELVFRRGAFDENALAMTAPALFWYASGLPFHGVNMVLVRIFHSRLDLKTPLLVGIFVVAVHIGLNMLFVSYWGHVGIAMSNAATGVVHTLSLVLALQTTTPVRLLSGVGAKSRG